jgi:hypothetical protein
MLRDSLAGISVAGLLLPSAIAYAAIAGLSPDHAIIATLIGLGVYALSGRSRFAMVAPTSSSAAILAALILSMRDSGLQTAAISDAAVLAAGFCFLAAAALRAGALANFISRPVLQGFSLGIAITITARQLPAITGVPGQSASVLPLLWHVLAALPHWHPVSVAIGLFCLAALFSLRQLRGVPAAALILVAGVLLSLTVNLPALHVALVGRLAITLPHPSWPRLTLDDWTRVLELALPLFLILFAESWSSIRGAGAAAWRYGRRQSRTAGAGIGQFRLRPDAGHAGGRRIFRLLGSRNGGRALAPGRGCRNAGAAAAEHLGSSAGGNPAIAGSGRRGRRLLVSCPQSGAAAAALAHPAGPVCGECRGRRGHPPRRPGRHAVRRRPVTSRIITAAGPNPCHPARPDSRHP